MIIKIAKDFSEFTGARYRSDGNFSGEQFYEDILKPKFIECSKNGECLTVDFDDCYGFASSFLDESFGRLSSEYGKESVKKILTLISAQDPIVVEQVRKIIENPERKK